MPDKLKDLQELFLVEASKYRCCRWTTTCSQRALTATPERDRGQDRLHVHRGSVRHA